MQVLTITNRIPEKSGITPEQLKQALDALVADGRVVVIMDDCGVERYYPKTMMAGGQA